MCRIQQPCVARPGPCARAKPPVSWVRKALRRAVERTFTAPGPGLRPGRRRGYAALDPAFGQASNIKGLCGASNVTRPSASLRPALRAGPGLGLRSGLWAGFRAGLFGGPSSRLFGQAFEQAFSAGLRASLPAGLRADLATTEVLYRGKTNTLNMVGALLAVLGVSSCPASNEELSPGRKCSRCVAVDT